LTQERGGERKLTNTQRRKSRKNVEIRLEQPEQSATEKEGRNHTYLKTYQGGKRQERCGASLKTTPTQFGLAPEAYHNPVPEPLHEVGPLKEKHLNYRKKTKTG